MAIKGIDVSHYQGAIDWAKVKADGVKFAFIKATQGVGYSKVDYFRNNAPVALGNGIHVGAYHYGTFSTIPEAITEAKYFLSVVKDYKLTYPLVLDLEENKENVSPAQLTDAAINFLEVLENAGYFAMLYTGKSFLETKLQEDRLKPYALWIARYNKELGRNADIWQYTSDGKVNGINTRVDMNWAYRDFAAEISGMKAIPAVQAPRIIGRVRVIADDLRIRKGPGTNYPIIRKAVKGEVFDVYANVNDWHCVGTDAWVFGNNGHYLSLLR